MSLFDAGDCDDAEKSVAYCDRLNIERLESQLAAAYEDAAKIADDVCFCKNACKGDGPHDHDIECNACDVAKRIRAKFCRPGNKPQGGG